MSKNKNKIILEKYFEESFTDFSAYSSYRSMSSYSDGLKNGQRKVIYTIQRKIKQNMEKVSRLASVVGLETEYLHGDASMEETIVNIVRNWDKPLPILEEKGTYGSRTIPKASAPRYIYTKKNNMFDLIFPQDFYEIEVLQNFEGNKIEPKTLTPILPLLLINGNSGIGSGFSQKVLPRDPVVIKDIIVKYLKSTAKNPDRILEKADLPLKFPHYKGTIKTEGLRSVFVGEIKKVNLSTIEITDLPIGYNLDSYISVLEELIDKKKIVSYIDKSEDNDFNFVVKIKREEMGKRTMSFKKDEEGISPVMETFKLVKSQTEIFSCIGPDNSFEEFNSATEVLVNYMHFILEKYEDLRKYKIAKLEEIILDLSEKARFIKLVIEERIIVNNRPKKDIEEQLKKHKFEGFDTYLNMRIYSLTKERYEALLKEVEERLKEKTILETKTNKDLYLEDLKKITF